MIGVLLILVASAKQAMLKQNQILKAQNTRLMNEIEKAVGVRGDSENRVGGAEQAVSVVACSKEDDCAGCINYSLDWMTTWISLPAGTKCAFDTDFNSCITDQKFCSKDDKAEKATGHGSALEEDIGTLRQYSAGHWIRKHDWNEWSSSSSLSSSSYSSSSYSWSSSSSSSYSSSSDSSSYGGYVGFGEVHRCVDCDDDVAVAALPNIGYYQETEIGGHYQERDVGNNGKENQIGDSETSDGSETSVAFDMPGHMEYAVYGLATIGFASAVYWVWKLISAKHFYQEVDEEV